MGSILYRNIARLLSIWSGFLSFHPKTEHRDVEVANWCAGIHRNRGNLMRTTSLLAPKLFCSRSNPQLYTLNP